MQIKCHFISKAEGGMLEIEIFEIICGKTKNCHGLQDDVVLLKLWENKKIE